MLPSLKLFSQIPCPDLPTCNRASCFYSHSLPPVASAIKRRKIITPTKQSVDRPFKLPDSPAKPVDRALASRPTQSTTAKRPNPQSSRPELIPTNSRSQLVAPPSIYKTSPKPGHGSTLAATKVATTMHGPRRIAHTNAAANAGPPVILPNIRSHTPLKIRQVTANKIYEHFCRIYSSLQPDLATQHTVEQEDRIHQNTINPAGYKQMAMTVLMGLKKRPEAIGPTDIGIHGEWVDPGVKVTKSIEAVSRKYCISENELEKMGYPLSSVLATPGGTGPSMLYKKIKCDRCNRDYKVKDVLDQVDHTLCLYHHGRMRMVMKSGEKHRVYSCCEETYGNEGCVKGPHVYKDEDLETMHGKIAYIKTPVADPAKPRAGIVALDCEMGYTTAGMELIRLTVVGEQAKILIDEMVLPSHMIIDLNTRYSGIKTLAGVKHNLESIREQLFEHIDSNTILLGHGLENDMNALRLIHTNIIDTAALYPHPHGLPYRFGLRTLSTRHLSKFIQEGSDGHDSFEDAQTCMELLEVFLKNKSSQGG
ncbi:hypothetical protein CLU79DRAFT_731898 [Phycomyces nitens]|nr:hypothetical protein CLU79DRAFT_731898 [Phycomyces nitens]